MQQYGGSLLYIVLLFALLYFLMIRPQQQRQKKHQVMINNLKVNDSVVTVGGILGTVVKIKENALVVKVADGVRIEFLKTAISEVKESPSSDDEEKE